MDRLADLNCSEFTRLLSSKAAVPGGGGASALAGALGAALGSMVGELTVDKKKYADAEAELKEAMLRAEELRKELIGCIDEDARAFEPLSKVYSMPKETPGRDELLERALKDAAAAPMKILELSCRAVELLGIFADKGSRLAISDAATGAAICRAAIYGAAVNVRVNTALMKDRKYAAELDDRVSRLKAYYGELADEIYLKVFDRL